MKRQKKIINPDLMAEWETIDLPQAARFSHDAQQAIARLEELHLANDDLALKELKLIAISAITAIHQLVERKADLKAANALVAVLMNGIQRLHDAEFRQTDIFKKSAAKMNCWPGFLTVDKDVKTANAKIVREIQLGKLAPLNYQGKQWSRKTPEVVVALRLVKLLHELHADKDSVREFTSAGKKNKLPTFSRRTSGHWWRAAEPHFERLYGKEFQNHRIFARHLAGADQLVKNEKKKARGLVRREIKNRIRQAFKSIAPKMESIPA